MRLELSEGAKVGRYVLLTKLAQGGMANVWLAQATGAEGFQKTVVIKTILPHLADDPEFVRMFIHEAVIAAQLEHPNIVHIFDLGEADGQHYITMEHISGRTLRHIQRELRRTKRVPPPWLVLRVASSVCDALDYAHGKADSAGKPLGLVHRDISPENIMVAFTGETKVLDFGIAKATTAASKTRVGVLKGKHAYMAPEQIEGAMEGIPPTGAVDLYALGVVMYELITGRRPFRAQNDLALMRKILDDEPRPPESFCSWVSPSLSALILKAMARNPAMRFKSALELRGAIDDYFVSIRSLPTSRHVAEYVRSLFGDASADAPPSVVPTPVPEAGQGDPWDTDAGVSTGHDSSLTIDLSMVLLSGEDSVDVAPESKPESTSTPFEHRRSTFPPSSLALPPTGWDPSTPQQVVTGPGSEAELAGGLGAEVDELPDWGPASVRSNAVPVFDTFPGPTATPSDVVLPRPATSALSARDLEMARPAMVSPTTDVSPAPIEKPSMAAGQSVRVAQEADRGAPAGHFWDLAARKAKEQRSAEASEPGVDTGVRESEELREPAAGQDGHSWDAVVDRLRRQEAEDRGQRVSAAERRHGLSAEIRATTLFEQGLERMRAKDLRGAMECWTKAVELDPENRLYQSNLRVLKRQLAERDKAG